MKCMYDTRLAWLLTQYFIICIGVGPTTCPRSLISRNGRQGLLSPYIYMDLVLKTTQSMWWIQHRPRLIRTTQAAAVRHAPETQCKLCATGYSFHFVLCGPTTWSVSCCRPAALLLAVILLMLITAIIALLPNKLFVHCMVTSNKKVPRIVYLQFVRTTC